MVDEMQQGERGRDNSQKDETLPTADGRPPLVMIGQPMQASGFSTLALHLLDRTVVTHDPRGLGRSSRKDGRVDHTPTIRAADVHAVIEALDAGPVDMFASSGGAVTALALVAVIRPPPVCSSAAAFAFSSASPVMGRSVPSSSC